MTRHLISTILLLISTVTFGQRNIILTKYPQKVPYGKKWVLPLSKALLIEVNEGTLVSGTLCNAKFLTRNPSISAIIEGQYGRPNTVYGISFKDLTKVAYTNGVTFSITPISFSSYSYSNSQDGVVQSAKNITFYQGQTVYITECLESLQAIELTLTQAELVGLNQQEKAKKDLEIKREKEQEKERLEYQRKQVIDKLTNNKPFRSYELENNPSLVISDTTNFQSDIINQLLADQQKSQSFDIQIDTTGKIVNVINSNADNGKLITFFADHFKVSDVGFIKFNNKRVKVSFILPVELKVTKSYQVTKQTVSVKKKRNDYLIESRDANYFSGNEIYDLERNPFKDTSYMTTLRNYILNQSPVKTTGYNNRTIYVRKNILRVCLDYGDNDKYCFDYDIWNVSEK